MSTVLLTGGTGYIGSHTAVEFLQSDYEVVIVDNLVNSKKEVVNTIEQLSGRKITFYEGDVRDETLMNRIFKENRIDLVVHFAGLKAVGESVSIPLNYYDNNLNSTIILIRSMIANGVNKLVFSSSATVYAEENPSERVEGMRLGCTSPYGWTKFMCEQIIRDSCRAYKPFSAISLRYFNPVGAHPSGKLGENPRGIPNNLMPYIQQVACGKLEKLHVYGDDYKTVDGTGERDYIHVCDLAEAHKAACDYLMKNDCCIELNIGNGKPVSVLELVHAFEKANNLKINYQIDGRRPGDIDCYYANPSKANTLLNWKATRTVEDMCADAYRYQQSLQKEQ